MAIGSLARSLLLMAGLTSSLAADTITVCLDGTCDFTDPAAAVATAVTGDVVEIGPGTYELSSTVVVYAQVIEIRGAIDRQGMPATILDGGGLLPCMSLLHLDESAVFENLVITNGRAEYGGGVYMINVDAIFRNCHVVGNVADWRGGGLFLNSSSPTFMGCEISGNSAGNTQFPGNGSGGGIVAGTGVVTMLECTVTGNAADSDSGGVYVTSGGSIVFNAGRLCGNTAPASPQIGNGSGVDIQFLDQACFQSSCEDCPDVPACVPDLNTDGMVNGADLGLMLASWGRGCPLPCAADLNGDQNVNGADLGLLLAAWGQCP
jgi:hypothetical protein